MYPPQKIVCLTEETVETLYLLGEDHRIVGVTGFATRPPKVRREKPRISTYITADIPKILALEPDLVLTFSDLQSTIAADLIKAGITVHSFNQRDIAGIFAMIHTLGALVGAVEKAETIAQSYKKRIETFAELQTNNVKPKVYFEEWDNPLISGVCWVSELIEIAGGIDVFANIRHQKSAKDRIITSEQVIEAAPDVILASWCGKKVNIKNICARDGWNKIPAVQNNRVYEIKSSIILQAGPAALTDGLDAIYKTLNNI